MKELEAYDLVVIGGGAAGFFGAINAATISPSLRILILEKTNKLLSKVRVSGGGRCNVTHHCFEPTPLSKHYPRGQKELKKSFRVFQAKDTVNWFEARGVKLKVEGDGRIFPTTDNSETVINCFLEEAGRLGIQIKTKCDVLDCKPTDRGFIVTCTGQRTFSGNKVLIATGGANKETAYEWIKKMGHSIINPIPSLFTFNDSEKRFADLMGIAVEQVEVKIAGTKYVERGPLLLTHWGLSGPVVIKLSAWAAEYLNEADYQFTVLVNWLGGAKEHEAREELETFKDANVKKTICKHTLFSLPSRLWIELCKQSDIEVRKVWGEISKRQLNKLVENLTRCSFRIKGKTTFKEEFVICGGVDLKDLDIERMESKKVKGIHFAGEVLNVDGETGGFNFQSAWTTAYLAAKSIAEVSD